MTQVTDPVCGMVLDSETAQHTFEYQGITYYFCCPGCKRAFEREPERYLSGDGGGHHGHMGPMGGRGKMKGMKKGMKGGMKGGMHGMKGGRRHGQGMHHDKAAGAAESEHHEQTEAPSTTDDATDAS